MPESATFRRVSPAWRRWALAVSIILNLFFAALVGSYLLHQRVATGPFESPLRRALANAQSILSPADSQAFTDVIVHNYPHYEQAEKQLNASRRALWHQLAAADYDPARVKQALADWRDALSTFTDDFSDTLAEAAGAISPEGRRKLIASRRGDRDEADQP
jgi:uncharacterized membrane protein